ncbi:MAG: hypothetical protein HN831_00125 [Waddliaceae bacterium]|nr:hypothetical protein [Waddliaceae bacterium]MBT7263871.1 hypothetical protein [Waddliaceae bacterium]MBT7461098.1 hypothetical protein [Waddliaceae bacterium]
MKKFAFIMAAAIAVSSYAVCAEDAETTNDTSNWYDVLDVVYKDVHGKVDLGAATMLIENKYADNRGKLTNMTGGRLAATFVYPNGFTIKPSVLAGFGEGHIYNGGIAIGWYLPIGNNLRFIPNIAYSMSYLKTKNIEIHPAPGFAIASEEASIQSRVPAIGVDTIVKFGDKWAATLVLQYAWSHSKSHFSNAALPQDGKRTESRGLNSAINLEYFIDDSWSTSLTLGINDANDNELNGVTGRGVIIGAGYRF